MTAKEVLTKARKLIDTPEKWTKGADARNPETGRPVAITSPKAGAFCAYGALRRAVDNDWMSSSLRLAEVLFRDASGRGIGSFNDDPKTTHADVMRAFRKAARAA